VFGIRSRPVPNIVFGPNNGPNNVFVFGRIVANVCPVALQQLANVAVRDTLSLSLSLSLEQEMRPFVWHFVEVVGRGFI